MEPPHLMVILGVWIQAAGCITATLSDEPRARPVAAYLAAGALLATMAAVFGPIEYIPSHRDPFLYPVLMAFLSAFVLFAGRTAVFGILPFREWPAVNWLAAHQWPAYHWPIDVPLLALIPAALAGISGGLLGWLTGGRVRRMFVSGSLA